MRPRVVAVSTAALIAAAYISPISAQAAGQNTIFVNNSNPACTDSGTGTIAAPFCTLQVAADAANPGDVVNVATGSYAATNITKSGTASAPIVFTGAGVWYSLGLTSTASTTFVISGANHVRIQNFALLPGTNANVVVDGGSDIAFTHDIFRFTTVAEPALHVTDGASAVTVQDSLVNNGIVVDGGSTGTVLTTNKIYGYNTSAVSVVGAANTAITSNTINGCGPSVSVTGSATGTSIENNVAIYPQSQALNGLCPASSQAYGILVDSAAAPGTTADYNDVYAVGTGSANYSWSGTTYPSAAALFTAVGQAKHDDNSVLGTEVTEQSPLINSADSAAIGEQALDITGHARFLDPLVTPTGAGPYNYYDRGAVQFQDPLSLATNTFTSSFSKVPVGATITLHAAVTDSWSDTFDYQFQLSNGTTVDAGTSGTATVSFSTPGTYSAYLIIAPTSGAAPLTREGTLNISVVPQAPLTLQLSAAATGAYGVFADDIGSTDAWNINSDSYDFGDGTPAQTVQDGFQAQHTYAKAGTYTITVTVTDQGGNSATKSIKFTTNALVAGTLINSGGGLPTFTPANSTGIGKVAVTSMPDDSAQLVAATTAGAVEFATGTSQGNVWKNWQVLSQPGVTAKWVGIAGMPNGTSQLIEVTSTGTLLHTVRNANGTWQSSGWGSPAGSTGFAQASITGMPDGSAQLVAVTTAGVLMHNIRNANGSWQGWRALSQPGVKVVDASIAGLSDGSSQILEVTSGSVMKHNVRFPAGNWQPQGWGVPPGGTGIAQVSISATAVFGGKFGFGATVISAVTTHGGLLWGVREGTGMWEQWVGSTSGFGDLGTVAETTISTLPSTGNYLIFDVTGG